MESNLNTIKNLFNEADHWGKIGRACDLLSTVQFRVTPKAPMSFFARLNINISNMHETYSHTNKSPKYDRYMSMLIVETCNLCIDNKHLFLSDASQWLLPAIRMMRNYFESDYFISFDTKEQV